MKKTSIILISLSPVLVIFIVFFIIKRYGNNNAVVSRASRYLGQLEKTKGSFEYGYQNSIFEKRMRAVGWKKGYDWCALFVKLVFLETYRGDKLKVLKQLMNASTQRTYKNFKDNENKYNWFSISKNPKRGSIAVYQSVSNSYLGHFAIVKSVSKNGFTTIEGNVQTKDGYDGVNEKKHLFTEFKKTSGNKLMDFINFK